MSFRLHELDTLVVDFKQVIVPVILFTCYLFPALFAKQTAHVSLVLSPLYDGVFPEFEQVINLVLLYLALFVN